MYQNRPAENGPISTIQAGDVAFASGFETRATADYDASEVAPARVTIAFKDGRVVTMERLTMKGAPDEPMSEEEILAKFNTCLFWGFDARESSAELLRTALMNLEAEIAARKIVELFLETRRRPCFP